MIDKNEDQNNDQLVCVWASGSFSSKYLWPKLALLESSCYPFYTSIDQQKPDFGLWGMVKTDKGKCAGMLRVGLFKTIFLSIIPGDLDQCPGKLHFSKALRWCCRSVDPVSQPWLAGAWGGICSDEDAFQKQDLLALAHPAEGGEATCPSRTLIILALALKFSYSQEPLVSDSLLVGLSRRLLKEAADRSFVMLECGYLD